MSACPGCGLDLPAGDGPGHAYIGASPACWELYGELLAREYGELGYPSVHRTTVDTYAVQHPGEPERRTINSVCTHLIGLCLVLEHGLPPERVRVLLHTPRDARWLEPPRPNGTLTVRHPLSADSAEEHERRVLEWAADVWAAWEPHHETVRHWVSPAL